ncbi:MAG: folate family ECF transporter S component [Bacillota bacterium]
MKSRIAETKYIAYIAVLVAINVLLNAFSLPLLGGIVEVSFTYIPCFIAGIFMGPVAGLLVGLLGDLLGVIIYPHGAWIPLITLASALMGFIVGLIFKYLPLHAMAKLIISLVVVFIICSAGINTYALYVVYAQGSKTFWVYLIGRTPTQSLVYLVNGIILYAIYYPLKKLIFKEQVYFHGNKAKTAQ